MGFFGNSTIMHKIRRKPAAQQLLRSSPLRRRIIVINLVVLLIPIVGFLWADSYRQSLIDAEVSALMSEAEIIAAAIAESAVLNERNIYNEEDWNPFNLLISQQVLRRVSLASSARPRLWNMDGQVLVGHSSLMPKKIRARKLASLGSFNALQDGFQQTSNKILRNIAWAFSYIHELPVEKNVRPPFDIDNFPEVQLAIRGKPSSFLRRSGNSEYSLTISAAVPIKQYRRIYGVIQLNKDSKQIDLALERLYRQIFTIFFVALAIMMVLSFWLAATIATPLNSLANAADRIRRNKDRKVQIPSFPKRKDEIGYLANNLHAMTEDLWQRMEAIESFAADVAHELKNPLTSLQSAVETLGFAKKPEQKERLSAIIKQDVERLNRLITDISDASRLDAELLRVTTEYVEVKQLVSSIMELYRTTHDQEKNISFILEDAQLPVKEVFVAAHQDRLVQVLRNLITNALSFAPDNSTLMVKLSKEETNVLIDIIDEGVGIPENALEKIFQRFYSERPKQEAFGNHSGLGLSISRQIVEAYHGSLSAHNRDDGKTGAIFRIILPIFKEIK